MQDQDQTRLALESLALEAYRSQTLSEEQIRQLLGFESRFDVHAFLKEHDVYMDYTREDLKQDIQASESLSRRE